MHTVLHNCFPLKVELTSICWNKALFLEAHKGLYIGSKDGRECWKYGGVKWDAFETKELEGDVQRWLQPLFERICKLAEVEVQQVLHISGVCVDVF